MPLNEHGFWVGTYIRLGTRVGYNNRIGTIIEHDDAWNNRVKFDFYDDHGSWEGGRADHFTRSDGTPLQERDITPTKGVGRVETQDEVEWLRRLLQWCRLRLSDPTDQTLLDTYLATGSLPDDEPPVAKP